MSRSFWINICLLFCTVQVFGADAPQGKARKETDSVGREWELKNWNENERRPYPKGLNEREAWYRQKWGEEWYGPINRCRIHNPGNWQCEVVTTVPQDIADKIKGARNHRDKWGNTFNIMIFPWAPGGGEVSDIYVNSDNCIYHYDPVTKRSVLIGNPLESGLRDGKMGDARLSPGSAITLDNVTGRLYFIQGNALRYVEKLVPYECTRSKKICYLPAVLGWQDTYRNVRSPFGGELKPALIEGKRRDPVFVVRTDTALKTLTLPGANRGRRPLITPDGKGAYFAQGWVPSTSTNYETTILFDLATGSKLEKLMLKDTVPANFNSGTDGPGTHGGSCVGYEGNIYTAQHGGCCGPCGSGPGRMFSIDPRTGKIVMLYDSMAEDGTWKKEKKGVLSDGPADARSLAFTSTFWQVQCPRTGAIINGGWDCSGIRRYHDGFVTSFTNGEEDTTVPARPGWSRKGTPQFFRRNASPSIAPDGSLYLADVMSNEPRILRIHRTDWPKEQPVNGYAEKFMPRERMESLMLDYAKAYIMNFTGGNKLLEER